MTACPRFRFRTRAWVRAGYQPGTCTDTGTGPGGSRLFPVPVPVRMPVPGTYLQPLALASGPPLDFALVSTQALK